MAQPQEWRLERYRALLKLQVRQLQLDPRFERRFDSSDLVHDTYENALATSISFTRPDENADGEGVEMVKVARPEVLRRA